MTDPVSGRALRKQTMDPADVETMVRVHEETGAARFVAGHFAEEGAAVFLAEVLRQVAP